MVGAKYGEGGIVCDTTAGEVDLGRQRLPRDGLSDHQIVHAKDCFTVHID